MYETEVKVKGKKDSNCAQCSVIQKACRFEEGKGPAGCPTVYKKEVIDKVLDAYDRPEINEFAVRLRSRKESVTPIGTSSPIRCTLPNRDSRRSWNFPKKWGTSGWDWRFAAV